MDFCGAKERSLILPKKKGKIKKKALLYVHLIYLYMAHANQIIR